MPVTPFHVGPGSLIKVVLREKFSLTIFSFAQIVIDLQPLISMLGVADVEVHGFTHTYLGATLVALVVLLTSKPVCEYYLRFWNRELATSHPLWHFSEKMSWPIVTISAFLGTQSHVLLDCIMHAEIQPFYPLDIPNRFSDLIDAEALHKLCAYAGVAGFAGYFGVGYILLLQKAKKQR